MPWPRKTSTCRSFVTISSGLCRLFAIVVLFHGQNHTSRWTRSMGVDHPEKDGNLLSPDNLQYPPLVLSRGIFVSDKDRRPDDRRGDRSGGLSGKPGKIDLSGKNPDSSSPDKIPDNSHLDDVKENDELGTSKLQVPRLGK